MNSYKSIFRTLSLAVSLLCATVAHADETSCLSEEIKSLPANEVKEFVSFVDKMIVLDLYSNWMGETSYLYNKRKDLEKKGQLKSSGELGQRNMLNDLKDGPYYRPLFQHYFEPIKADVDRMAPKYKKEDFFKRSLYCYLDLAAQGTAFKLSGERSRMGDFLDMHTATAESGYFRYSLRGCAARAVVGTGNRFAEPKPWEGSRFYIVDVAIKNQDNEGRTPSTGHLIIKLRDGKEYKFDASETILAEGYGIYFKSINPLIEMRTKIVYRVPNELSGIVYWVPGRNPDDKRLFCSVLTAQK